MNEKRYWLTPSGEFIDCNTPVGHSQAVLTYCRKHNISTTGRDCSFVFYKAGFVRILIQDSVLHTEFYKPLTLTQINKLGDYASENGLTLFNDLLDRQFEPVF